MRDIESFEKKAITQMARLHKYLLELQMSDRACVFADLSGHVDWLNVKVVESREDYQTALFERQITVPSSRDDMEYLKKRDWKEYINEFIEDIEYSLTQRDEKIRKRAEEIEQNERKRFEELKAKFES